MPEAPEANDYTRFTVKDLLALVVLPRLDTIERKIDGKADAADLNLLAQTQKHEADALIDRVRSLEAWRSRILGALTIIGLGVPFGMAAAAKMFLA